MDTSLSGGRKKRKSGKGVDKSQVQIEAAIENKRFSEAMDWFKVVNPTSYRLFGNKTERAAMRRLLDRFGYERVENMVKIVAQTNGQMYAPTITTPWELEVKMGKLAAFITKEGGNKKGKVIL